MSYRLTATTLSLGMLRPSNLARNAPALSDRSAEQSLDFLAHRSNRLPMGLIKLTVLDVTQQVPQDSDGVTEFSDGLLLSRPVTLTHLSGQGQGQAHRPLGDR